MFAFAVAKITNSLFPIYRTTIVGQDITVAVSGSGFFVDAHGTFVTVAHAFDNAAPGAMFQFRGRSPDHFQNPALPLVEIARDDQKDILIGRVEGLQLTHGLDVHEAPFPLGTSVCVAGYPLAQLAVSPDGGLDVSNVRRYFQNAMALDYYTGVVERRLHQGFMMTEFSLFGMSGGPVVTTDGAVVGMQASVTNPRVSIGAGGRQIIIENAVAIGSEHIHAMVARVSAMGQPAAAARRG